MLLARVIGTAIATIKHHSMRGRKLMIVQPLMADGVSPDGDPLVVVDGLGAGIGQRVILTSDGVWSRELLQTKATPVRWTVAGIADQAHGRDPSGIGNRIA